MLNAFIFSNQVRQICDEFDKSSTGGQKIKQAVKFQRQNSRMSGSLKNSTKESRYWTFWFAEIYRSESALLLNISMITFTIFSAETSFELKIFVGNMIIDILYNILVSLNLFDPW